jgi:hypothetical protein
MKLSEWKNELERIYALLPDKLHNYPQKVMLKSVALDWLLLQDFENNVEEAIQAITKLYELEDNPDKEHYNNLYEALNKYYLWRRDDGRWEKKVFGSLKKKPIFPIFVMSYNRPNKNATLDMFDKWNSQELYDNTFVFVQEDQVEEYRKHHPKYNYVCKDVKTVGERFMEILKVCVKLRIKYAMIIEDDIYEFRHVKKGGVDGNSKMSLRSEDYCESYLKYIQYKGLEIMRQYEDCIVVGVRNRVMCNNEASSIIGYNDPMRGGCPNMVFFLDIFKFYPIYRQIPVEHYSPQNDWALQCAMVKNHKKWAMITGVCKGENVSKSVIKFTGDRTILAQEYLKYYGVEDSMSWKKFKGTELEGTKLFYNQRLYDNTLNQKLF